MIAPIGPAIDPIAAPAADPLRELTSLYKLETSLLTELIAPLTLEEILLAALPMEFIILVLAFPTEITISFDLLSIFLSIFPRLVTIPSLLDSMLVFKVFLLSSIEVLRLPFVSSILELVLA